MIAQGVTRNAPRMCSGCGYLTYVLGTADGSAAPPPDDGDVAACLNCGALHTLHGGQWLATTAAEYASFDDEFRHGLAMNERARKRVIRVDLTKHRGGRV